MSNSTSRRALRPSSPNPFDVNRAVCKSDLSPSAKVVLMAILGHAHHGRSTCTAATATLAAESGLSARHVQRLLKTLAEGCWIELDRKTGSTHSRHFVKAGPKVHAVGQISACSRTNRVHEVGHGHVRVRDPEEIQRKNGGKFAPARGENPGGKHPDPYEAREILRARVEEARRRGGQGS
jgi:Helix-turn-helix domain